MSGDDQLEAGFTLAEILVAFLILAMALSVLLPSFSTGLNSLSLSRFHAAALAEARSQIDRLGIETQLEEGEIAGRSEDGLYWVIRLHRHEAVESRQRQEEDPSPVLAYEVEVLISDAAGRSLRMTTLRLAPIEKEAWVE